MNAALPAPILAIETSCDETAAAVIDESYAVRAEAVYSQIEEHFRWGGVVPEVASRAHLERLDGIVARVLADAGVEPRSVAVTAGPGLIGSLLVGVSFAKAFAFARGLPIHGIHHVAGHLAAVRLAQPDFVPPYLALAVSGGHTELILVESARDYRRLGRTVDDAAGEAFDKAAKLLGLGFPGGPAIEAAAGRVPDGAELPRLAGVIMPGTLDFSFSGLKTALRYHCRQHPPADAAAVDRIAAAFQAAVVDTLVRKAGAALSETRARRFVLCGGVAANAALRRATEELARKRGVDFAVPPRGYCTDNAAMIGAAALAGAGEPLAPDACASASLKLG